jgi:hypothetical protein
MRLICSGTNHEDERREVALSERAVTESPVAMSRLIAGCIASNRIMARAATLHLPHGPVPLPIFMPVATQASLKGLTPDQLEDQGCRLCLNNTYHLYGTSLASICASSC